MKKIIAVTGCPTGIAHTFMAEESLKKAAKEMGIEIKVETNGAIGVENELTEKDIKEADGVIIASDKDARADRFIGKPIIETSVQDGIRKPKELIQAILDGKAQIKKSTTQRNENTNEKTEKKNEVIGKYFLWGIYSADPASDQYNKIAAMLKGIGGTAFSMIVPIFTAFIASSIAGRSGMVAGFVGGLIADATGAGFIGGIIAGFFAGYLMLGLIKMLAGLPRQFEGLKSIFLLPILGILATGILMTLLGEPVSYINNSVMDWLASLESANPILLGLVIGCMSAFDFGGPVNKAAYITGTMLLSQGNYYFMAGVSAACITPPLVIALATTIFKKQFNEEDRAAGLVNYILGFTHITEGAIPFAAKDPLRVIPILMIGSSISSILTYLMKVQVPAPHGGFLILPIVEKPFIWVGCILIGSLVGAILYGLYKTNLNKKAA